MLSDGEHVLDSRKIDVKKAIPHIQHQVRMVTMWNKNKRRLSPSLSLSLSLSLQAMKNRTKKIFVGGVPTEMTKEILEEYFQQFGEVRSEGRSL